MNSESIPNQDAAKDTILAMYDIRGKQEFIYKSTHMKEIVGASLLIRDCFQDFLLPASRCGGGKGIYHYKDGRKEEQFSRKSYEAHLRDGYVGEVVYDGGGNFLVLYQNKETYIEINKRFYRKLLEGTYSLKVLTTYITEVNWEDFKGDRDRLYAKHHRREQEECAIHPVNTLPVVQVDYHSSLPLARIHKKPDNTPEKVSYESMKKYEKYDRELNVTASRKDNSEEMEARKKKAREIEGARILDELITKKGEDSHLAVIYIDGNNMGAQVEQCIGELRSYDECVNALRRFSEQIQKHYIDERIQNIDTLLHETDAVTEKGRERRRFVVYAGDEITFVCNAKDALAIVKEYLTRLAGDYPGAGITDRHGTSCAGIAIFHSHAPFSDAYRIAEECCESGKKKMRELQVKNAAFMDFHYCQGAIGTSLEDIRRHENTLDSSRPWLVVSGDVKAEYLLEKQTAEKDCQIVTLNLVKELVGELEKIGRSNIKGLQSCAKKSQADFQSELERIQAHQNLSDENTAEVDFTLKGKLDKAMQQKLIYDAVLVYDLWFSQKKGSQAPDPHKAGQDTKENGGSVND